MRLAVLSSPESWYFRDLVRAAAAAHDLTCLPFTGLQSAIGLGVDQSTCAKPETATGLEPFDAVLVRSMPPGSLEQVVFRMDLLGRGSIMIRLTAPRGPQSEWAMDDFVRELVPVLREWKRPAGTGTSR